MKWSELTWQRTEDIYQKIISHPFNQELLTGKLSAAQFQFYIQQDAIYLGFFSKALALIAARCFNNPYSLDFVRFAEGAVVVEKALHSGYINQFGLSEELGISATCQTYTQFLLCTACLDQVEIAMASVLPCFWIYKKVGDYIYGNQQPGNNPYQDWINTYAGDEFSILVDKAIAICDDVAASCSAQQREGMTEAFIKASKLEWMFWDSAYRMESWPI